MLSLAAINYRDIFTSDGGPIDRVSAGSIDVLGKLAHQANAYLAPGLIRRKPELCVYGNADGTGASGSPLVARHMAISEALERWALVSWWSGHMRASVVGDSLFGVTALRLEHSAKFGEVAILFRRSAAGHVSYGYSAGSTFRTAAARAAVELARNEFVVGFYKVSNVVREVPNCFERRCLYFAGEEGHSEFLRRVFDRRPRTETKWSVLFDGELSGPWSKYATVWRVMPAMPSRDYLDPQCPFFFW